MLPSKVDEMLKNYRTAKGRTAHLDIELNRLERELRRTVAADREEIADISGHQYDVMPHGNAVGQPTEQKALKLYNLPESQEVAAIRQRIHEITMEQEEHFFSVHFVEAWLGGLTEKERWIIEKQTIDSVSWKEVAYHYSNVFGHSAKIDTLRRIKRLAMDKIYKMAN